jgi:hypothetical protein
MSFFIYTVSKTYPQGTIRREEFAKETDHFFITDRGRRVAKEAEHYYRATTFEEALQAQSRFLQAILIRAKATVEATQRDIRHLPTIIRPTDENYIDYLKARATP